jgi:hypothetical protein
VTVALLPEFTDFLGIIVIESRKSYRIRTRQEARNKKKKERKKNKRKREK